MRASAELSEGSYDHKGSCEQGSLATEEDVVDEARVPSAGRRDREGRRVGTFQKPGQEMHPLSSRRSQEPPCSQARLSPARLSHHLGSQTVRQHVCAVTAAVVSPHSGHRKQTDRQAERTERGQSRLSHRAAVCFRLFAPRLPHL